jgi:hypothetical protein
MARKNRKQKTVGDVIAGFLRTLIHPDGTPAYRDVILREKPIAYYPLATDTKDHSGHGHHATFRREEGE